MNQMLAPLSLAIWLYLLGWLLRRILKRRVIGRLIQWSAIIGILFVGAGGLEPFLYRLEQSYPPFEVDLARAAELRGAEIAVLGQGLVVDSPLAVRFRDNDVFRNRISEAARIAHLIPESRLLISMAGRSATADKEAALLEYAMLYQLPRERMVLLGDGLDTESEARLALEQALNTTVIVVTSASHLPRAIKLFEQIARNYRLKDEEYIEPFNFIPAPCDYQVRRLTTPFNGRRLPLPCGDYIRNAERYLHEVYGRIYESLR